MSVATQCGFGQLNCRQSLRGLIAVALGTAALAGPSGPAFAQQVTSSVTVKHVDRHLSSDRAARQLLGRLGLAALEVCGGSPFGLREANEGIRSSQCWRDSMADVVSRIDDPHLTTAFRRLRRHG